MVKTVADMLAAAHAVVKQVDIKDAKTMIEAEDALLLDVRDAPEVEKTGLAKGAHHISRGMLEFRADTLTQFHDKELRKDRPIVIYCASGGRAALAGKLLVEMGYQKVYNLGGFKDWAEHGGEVQHLLDPGMG